MAIPVNTHFLADLFSLDLITPENPNGSLTTTELYRALLHVRTWGFNNNDPGLAWNRRRMAQESASKLTTSTLKVINSIAGIITAVENNPVVAYVKKAATKIPALNSVGNVIETMYPKTDNSQKVKDGTLRWHGAQVAKELLGVGKKPEEVTDILWLTAVAGVGVPVGMVSILNFFHHQFLHC